MRFRHVLTAVLALVVVPPAARAGSVCGGLNTPRDAPWSFEETWTSGSYIVHLKLTVQGTPSGDLLQFLERFITLNAPAPAWQPTSGVVGTTPGPASGPAS